MMARTARLARAQTAERWVRALVAFARQHRPVVVHPVALLVVINALAATGMFGFALFWYLNGTAWFYWVAWTDTIKIGGGLSVVALAGAWLERH